MEFAEDHRLRRVRCRRRRSERERVLAPTKREDGIPPNQIEYKARRLVNDYLQPPKVTRKIELGAAPVRRGARGHGDSDDRAQLARTDARARGPVDPGLRRHGGARLALPRPRAAGASITSAPNIPEKDNENWFCHTLLSKKDGNG